MISGKSKFAALILAASVSGSAQAALHDRGAGLIYDDVLNVTWLQDVTYAQTSGTGGAKMSWNDGVIWAASLGYYDSVREKLLFGWRLPSVTPLNGINFTYTRAKDGSSDSGWNISAPGTLYEGSMASELAYMYHITLGNKAAFSETGVFQGEPLKTGPFKNLERGYFWSGNGYVDYGVCQPMQCAWMFSMMDSGKQGAENRGTLGYAWLVRDGDVVAVPEPKAYALMFIGLGLVGAAAMRRRRRFDVSR